MMEVQHSQLLENHKIDQVLKIEETRVDPDGTGETSVVWQSTDDKINWTDLTTESTYTISANDLNKNIRAKN